MFITKLLKEENVADLEKGTKTLKDLEVNVSEGQVVELSTCNLQCRFSMLFS
jgi:hypothetical protein